MRPYLPLLVVFSSLTVALVGCGGGSAGSSATPTPAPTATPSPAPIASPTPSPVPTRSFQLTVTGSRGSVALGVNGSSSSFVPGAPRTVTTALVGTNLLSAPASYGDKAFVAWQRNGTNFSTNTTLSTLPSELTNGDTVTALYGPAGTRTGQLTPNYNQTDAFYWPADKLPLKVFFADNVSSDYKAAMQEGIDRWMNALGSGITYTVVTQEADATIVLQMGDASGFLAQTTTTASALSLPKPLLKAVITFDPTKVPVLNSNTNRLGFTALAAHEFGHALGINGGGVQGHSDDPADIMHAIVGEDSQTITVRDINTMMNLYASIYDGRKVAVSRAASNGKTTVQTLSCGVRLR